MIAALAMQEFSIRIEPAFQSSALNQLELFTYSDSVRCGLGRQKEPVKRLCRGGETLLSRPGRGAA